nr:uncharacterized protein LOC113460618 [Zonotrichia albicollis]
MKLPELSPWRVFGVFFGVFPHPWPLRMGYCAALYCRNGTSGAYRNSSVSFYSFPLQNQALLRQWLQNMGRDMETPSKYQSLCSEHFEESSFEAQPVKTRKRRRLLKEAVPSKFILALDGTWLVGTPRAGGDVMGNKSRKRVRISEPCGKASLFLEKPPLFLEKPAYFLKQLSFFLKKLSCFLKKISCFLKKPSFFMENLSCFLEKLSCFLEKLSYFLKKHSFFLEKPI